MPVEFTTTDSTGIQIGVSDLSDPGELEPIASEESAVQRIPADWVTGEEDTEDPTKPIRVGSSQEPVDVIIIDPSGA